MAALKAIAPAKKTAVVLMNLGGPDNQQAVRPFLFNLFYDPAIIGLPRPLRYLLARLISGRRAPLARGIYARMGGGSPIVANTQAQAEALRANLAAHGEVSVFLTMRYWHPRAREVVRAVREYNPDQILLLPLYPQYSTTTTGSSLQEWQTLAKREGLRSPTRTLCCYPTQSGFIAAQAQLIRTYYDLAAAHGQPRILFSAHGLPEKIIRRGDPYQAQVESTARAIIEALAIPQLDAVVCYQSRVGPLKWIGPATPDEVTRAGRDQVPVVLAPIAFVSEHSETLVELDIEYRELAHQEGVPYYARVPTVSTQAHFIAGLSELCLMQMAGEGRASHTGARVCPAQCRQCPCPLPSHAE